MSNLSRRLRSKSAPSVLHRRKRDESGGLLTRAKGPQKRKKRKQRFRSDDLINPLLDSTADVDFIDPGSVYVSSDSSRVTDLTIEMSALKSKRRINKLNELIPRAELTVQKSRYETFKQQVLDSKFGIDDIPDPDWDTLRINGQAAFKKMDIAKRSKKVAATSDKGDWSFISEPHGKPTGWSLAREAILESKKPGVLMLEAPTFLNQSENLLRDFSYWAIHDGGFADSAPLIKEALAKGWEVLAVDGFKMGNDGNVDAELLKKSGIPGLQNQIEESGVGSDGRQKYLARNVKDVIKSAKDEEQGGMLVIGTAHIRQARAIGGRQPVTALSSLVSNVPLAAANKTVYTPNGSGQRFYVVPVSKDSVT